MEVTHINEGFNSDFEPIRRETETGGKVGVVRDERKSVN